MTLLLAGTLLLPASASAQQVGFNDLTDISPNPVRHTKFVPGESCEGGSGGGAIVIGCPPPTYPFKLSLLNLDTSELHNGGDVIALLRLENTGRDPASVPWTTHPDLIELPDDNGTFEYLQADLSATVAVAGGAVRIDLPVHLYGAKQVSGSLQEIRPGEFVELLVKLTVDCKTEPFHCQSLKPGPAKLGFTWTEWQARETYQKCGIQSSLERLRLLNSDSSSVDVISKLPAQQSKQ